MKSADDSVCDYDRWRKMRRGTITFNQPGRKKAQCIQWEQPSSPCPKKPTSKNNWQWCSGFWKSPSTHGDVVETTKIFVLPSRERVPDCRRVSPCCTAPATTWPALNILLARQPAFFFYCDRQDSHTYNTADEVIVTQASVLLVKFTIPEWKLLKNLKCVSRGKCNFDLLLSFKELWVLSHSLAPNLTWFGI